MLGRLESSLRSGVAVSGILATAIHNNLANPQFLPRSFSEQSAGATELGP